MEELVQRIGAAVGVDEATAKAAIGHVLHFLQTAQPEGPVAELLAKIPNAQELIDQAAAAHSEGLADAALSGLGGLLGGTAGNVMALVGKLTGAGLDMSQMQTLGHELFAHADQLIGKENVDKIIEAVPAVAPFR